MSSKLYFGVRIWAEKAHFRENSVRKSDFHYIGNEWIRIVSEEILEIVPKRH